MSRIRIKNKKRGFTLIELLVALMLGLLVMGTAVTMFKKAMDMSVIMSQRAEMQQNARAGINAMVHDLSLAGTDLAQVAPGSIQLPQAVAPNQPRFGCPMVGACYLTNGNNIFAGGQMYYINPHTQDGTVIGTVTPDSLVVAYADPLMVLGSVAFSPAGDLTGSQITVLNPPLNIAAQANGIVVGDLIWLRNPNGSAIGVVTRFDRINTINFDAAGDPLSINQPPTQTGATITGNINGNITSNLENIPATNPPVIPGANGAALPAPQITAQRIFLVTYFVRQDATGRRLLMRQVNAQPATAVAENVENLQVTYDTVDNTVNPPVPVVNQRNPAGTPNLIRKVNIALTVRTTQRVGAFNDFQRLTLATSVSPRNLSLGTLF